MRLTAFIYFLAGGQKKEKKKSSFKNTPPCELDYVVIHSGSTPGLLAFWGKMTRFWTGCRAGRRGWTTRSLWYSPRFSPTPSFYSQEEKTCTQSGLCPSAKHTITQVAAAHEVMLRDSGVGRCGGTRAPPALLGLPAHGARHHCPTPRLQLCRGSYPCATTDAV